MKLVDENKRIASDHLKSADKLIKAGEFDRAIEEIAKARVADPRNLYILAYEERIQYAREDAQKKEQADRLKQETADQEQAAKNGDTDKQPGKKRPQTKIEDPPQASSEQPVPESPDEKKIPPGKGKTDKRSSFEEFVVKGRDSDAILELIMSNAERIARETVEDSQTKAQTEYKEKIDQEIHEYEAESQRRSAEQIQVAVATFQKRLETESQIKLENEIKELSATAGQALEERLLQLEDERQLRLAECVKELFTTAIEQLLVQGLTDEEFTRIITGIAHGLKISPEQTIQMKRKTQERFYMEAVEVAWSDGTVSLEESERLSALRDRFGITAEEHFQIESNVRRKMLEMKK
jgi:hypothetical protein